jgi:dihydroflavonol-4-reductase
MTAFVTGGTGFIGAAVVRQLLAAGEEVRCLVRPHGDRRNLAGLPVTLVEGDLRAPAGFAPGLAGCASLYHVAADYRLWTPDPAALYAANVDGTRDILRAAAAAGVARMVYTSSVATLGLHPDGTPADEATAVGLDGMIGHYKRSKYLAEQEVLRLVREEGLPVVIVNPSAPVGPRDIKPTPTGRMVADAAAGRTPAYVDTGLNLVHVDDVAAGHVLAHGRGRIGERYILGGENLTLREILETINRLVGRQATLIRLPHGAILPIAYVSEFWARLTGGGEPRVTVDGVRLAKKRMFFTCAKAERELGYTHRPAVEALRDAIAWFQGPGSRGLAPGAAPPPA